MMKTSKKGLSLIEVLFAMGILGIVLTFIGYAFTQSAYQGASTKNKIGAMNDVKKMLEQVRTVADKNGLTGPNSVTDGTYWTNAGNGWLETQTFSNLSTPARTIIFPSGTGGNPLRVRATVTWQEKTGTRSYFMETLATKRTA